MVDPLLKTHPKREFSQCIAAAVQGFPDEYFSFCSLCEYITFAAPHNDVAPVVCALSLFSPTTARSQWLKRCLSFWLSLHLLEERARLLHPDKIRELVLPSMKEALQSRENMLEQMCVFLRALIQSLGFEKVKGKEFIWLHGLLVCLDATLGDREAIFSSEAHAEQISELIKQVQESFRSGEEMNEFASASRNAIAMMKDRIIYNIKFEKNRKETVAKFKAAMAIGGKGGGDKQTELPFTPVRK